MTLVFDVAFASACFLLTGAMILPSCCFGIGLEENDDTELLIAENQRDRTRRSSNSHNNNQHTLHNTTSYPGTMNQLQRRRMIRKSSSNSKNTII